MKARVRSAARLLTDRSRAVSWPGPETQILLRAPQMASSGGHRCGFAALPFRRSTVQRPRMEQVAAGRVAVHESTDDFLGHLDELDAE